MVSLADSIIQGIRDYISSCPLLTDGKVKVNYLGSEMVSYTIDEVPTETLVKRYMDGSSVRKFQFIFASREAYSASVLENMKVSGFYEQFSDWMEQQNMLKNLPILPDNCEAKNIRTLTNGYTLNADAQAKQQRYQIQCELRYLKRRNA